MANPQLVTPLDKVEKLTPFENRPVIAVGIEIPGAGGGLRDALTVDPREYHYGETVFVVIEGVVGKIRFDPVKGAGEAVRRVHVLDVESAAPVERETVEHLLAEQAKRIEEAMGIKRLEYDDELLAAHQRGEHADGVVEGCVECDKEVAAALVEEHEDGRHADEVVDGCTVCAAEVTELAGGDGS